MGKYNSVLSITESQFNRLEQLEFSDEELGRFLRLYRQSIIEGSIPNIKDRCLRAEVISAVQFRDYQIAKNEEAAERMRNKRKSQSVQNVHEQNEQSEQSNVLQKLDQITVTDKVKETIKEKEKVKVTTPSSHPSLTDIQHYLQAKNYTFTAERFYDYCSKKGWQNIDDWKKYADTWQSIEKPKKAKKRISDTMSRDEQTIKEYMNDLNDPTAL